MNQWTPRGQPIPDEATPVDVRTAWQLWWGVVVLGVLRLIVGSVGRYGHRHTIARNIYDQLHAQQPRTPLSTYELMVTLLVVLSVVFGLGIAAAAVAVAYQLRRGRLWARTLFDVATVVLVLGGVNAMFGLGMVAGTWDMLAGAAAILQAVLAGFAVFLCHRAESTMYFRMNGNRLPR
ncbi:hypothetical protein ABIA39_008394 [Nocardia sp. GAS34]|uniref:hypothetical protein n=1 Tax=unclassified Nocardia TaxID=2637762 RepID=UPI003D200490